ncbi:YraN family protein [Curvivirga sp.]|uniref:YraN family protein n=1 Tax=Curvivirga sp. TaxID=2856848 RepID=UPI003B5C87DA
MVKLLNRSHVKGQIAERKARLWLHLKGYKVLEYRYKTPVGEIDILARKGDSLIAVEVKARQTEEEAKNAIQQKQWERIARAITFYQSKHPEVVACDIRFDAIFVVPMKMTPIHIKNAWNPPASL